MFSDYKNCNTKAIASLEIDIKLKIADVPANCDTITATTIGPFLSYIKINYWFSARKNCNTTVVAISVPVLGIPALAMPSSGVLVIETFLSNTFLTIIALLVVKIVI